MICDDCKAQADFDALPGLVKTTALWSAVEAQLKGHLLCNRRGGAQVAAGHLPSCMCQHAYARKAR